MKHSKTLLSYMAGIIDGEGALFIARRKDKRKDTYSYQYQFNIAVSMTNKDVIDLLFATFGGNVHQMNLEHWKSYKSWYKPAWLWKCDSTIASKMIHAIYPYMVAKKKHAETFFEFEKTICRIRDSHGRWNQLSEENLAEKERCYLIFKELNVKGPRPHLSGTSASLPSQGSSQSEVV